MLHSWLSFEKETTDRATIKVKIKKKLKHMIMMSRIDRYTLSKSCES